MRVYHFLSSEYGLSDIALQRIKIARFGDLNDPFELLAVNVGGRKKLRKMLRIWKRQTNDTKGLLCFSRSKKNPVLWSHYAAKHYGICLGFDLSANLAQEVKYFADRIPHQISGEPTETDFNEEFLQTLFLSKFIDWSYEDEVRVIVDLNKHPVEGATYFYEFSTDLTLREVILGPLCELPVERVKNLIASFYQSVDVRKARLAFKWFDVVPDERYEGAS